MELKLGHEMTEIGAIPDDWKYAPIGDYIDLLTGFPFPSSGYSRAGVRLLRGSNVKRGVTDWSEDTTEYWAEVTPDIRMYVLDAGDIVIAMDGSLVGRSFAMLSSDDLPALLLQRVARLRSASIAQRYLKSWICSPWFTNHCDSVKTVTAIPHISPGDIKAFRIAIPPTKHEQEAIAAALNDADALIESLEQLIAKKRLIKQGAMQELLTGKKRLPGFSGAWEEKRLGDMAAFHKGKGLPKSALTPFGTEPCVHYGELFTQYTETIRETISRTNKAVGEFRSVANDVLMPTSDVTPTGLAKASCVLADDVVLGGDILVIRADPVIISGTFLSFVIRREEDQVLRLVTGTTVFHLYAADMKKFAFMLPPLPEQQAIVDVLSDMDAEIIALEQRRDKMRAIKEGMMQTLLTGKIRLVPPRAA